VEGPVIVRLAAVALLAAPFALALSRGGYFDQARLWAGIGAWLLVAVAAIAAPRPVPRAPAAVAALAGLAGLLAWTLLSFAWAPLRAPAVDDAQRLALYLGALLAATALLRGATARAVVPALAAGILATTLYGLSERLLPGVVELTRSTAAMGRLDQPLTYWNAMGAWAAIGLVLCARLAGEGGRPAPMRAAAAAAGAPLGAAIALSLSRGAIVAALIGLGVLAALDPRRPALRAAAVTAAAGLAAGVVAAPLPAVRTFEGARESQGLILLAALAALMAGAAALAGREAAAGRRSVGPARWRLVAAGLVPALVLAAGAAAIEGGRPEAGASPTRLSTAASNRYAYWEVALSAFADAPLHGNGSGSFVVDWRRERDVDEAVRDAHSLELETAAELGIAGLALLALLLGGVVVAAVRGGAAMAGPTAGLAVWAAHSALDWDWEMPALTLVAILLAGLVLAACDDAPRAGPRTRAVVAAVAVVMAAGLAVELRSANLVEAARENRTEPGAIDQLERAEKLTLDRTTPELERGNLLLIADREREAAALGDELVEREPENPFAWGIVGLAYERLNPDRSREALREQRRLLGREAR
jgi:O-Antigen ligase